MKYITFSLILAVLIVNSTIKSQSGANSCKIKLPVLVKNRCDFELLSLTKIGNFGEPRKARPTVPAHLHTGIDIKRPSKNYVNEPVYSIYSGKVISVRNDGPFAQIIIEHVSCKGDKFWSVYEHIAGITVKVGDKVNSESQIARYMNKNELNKFGWQFDHCHLEILKIMPRKIKVNPNLPSRFYSTFNIECYDKELLNKYYYNPIEFFRKFICI